MRKFMFLTSLLIGLSSVSAFEIQNRNTCRLGDNGEVAVGTESTSFIHQEGDIRYQIKHDPETSYLYLSITNVQNKNTAQNEIWGAEKAYLSLQNMEFSISCTF